MNLSISGVRQKTDRPFSTRTCCKKLTIYSEAVKKLSDVLGTFKKIYRLFGVREEIDQLFRVGVITDWPLGLAKQID